jgi:hypothetical protein
MERMNKVKSLSKAFSILVVLTLLSAPVLADTYTIEDEFDGCEHGKVYSLTNGQFFVCEEYQYFYEYRPRVIAVGNKVVVVGDEEVSGRIVDGEMYTTQIDGEWEGCDFDSHKLTNGWILQCNSYFYEYAYMPSVEIIVVEDMLTVKVNGQIRDGIHVFK